MLIIRTCRGKPFSFDVFDGPVPTEPFRRLVGDSLAKGLRCKFGHPENPSLSMRVGPLNAAAATRFQADWLEYFDSPEAEQSPARTADEASGGWSQPSSA
jgi:hypothetical protein